MTSNGCKGGIGIVNPKNLVRVLPKFPTFVLSIL